MGRRDGSSGTKSPRYRGGRDSRGQGQDKKGGCPEAGPGAGRLPRRSHPPPPPSRLETSELSGRDVTAARVTTQLRPWGRRRVWAAICAWDRVGQSPGGDPPPDRDPPVSRAPGLTSRRVSGGAIVLISGSLGRSMRALPVVFPAVWASPSEQSWARLPDPGPTPGGGYPGAAAPRLQSPSRNSVAPLQRLFLPFPPGFPRCLNAGQVSSLRPSGRQHFSLL